MTKLFNFIMSYIPRRYLRVHYRDHGKLVHANFSEVGLGETIYSMECIYMTPSKYKSLKEFES